MAYFYVKAGGTATGDAGRYASKQTGSFATMGASGYYSSIANAMAATTTPTSVDFICVSNSHSITGVSNTHTGPVAGAPLNLVCVDDSNCDALAIASAYLEYSDGGTADQRFSGRWYMYGMYLKTADDMTSFQSIFENCTFETTGSYDTAMSTGGDAAYGIHINTTWLMAAGSVHSNVTGGCLFHCTGGSTNSAAYLFSGGFINGGARVVLDGMDLSAITGTVFRDVGSSVSGDDQIEIIVRGCQTSGSQSWTNEDFASQNHRMLVQNSSSVSAEAEYQYLYQAGGGQVEDETSIYRDGSTVFPSGQKVSLKCVTSTLANVAEPFKFDAPVRYAELSDTASDKVRVYLLSSATLTDMDVWAELIYPDGTSKHIYNLVTSKTSDVLENSGTALTTNTETWTGRTTENRYQIDLDTSGDAGADCVPIIRVYVAKASTTIYFCPTIGLS